MNSNSFANSQRTIANLTNDDSKVLGNIKPKLKIVHERYNMTTNKYKTLNSSWTPLKDKNTNRTVNIQEIRKWFTIERLMFISISIEDIRRKIGFSCQLGESSTNNIILNTFKNFYNSSSIYGMISKENGFC